MHFPSTVYIKTKCTKGIGKFTAKSLHSGPVYSFVSSFVVFVVFFGGCMDCGARQTTDLDPNSNYCAMDLLNISYHMHQIYARRYRYI